MLYVGRSKRNPSQYDVGSVLCLRIVNTMLPKGKITVQEVSKKDATPWLTGTPTLSVDSSILTGHQAIYYLQDLALNMCQISQEQETKSKKPSRSNLQVPSSFSSVPEESKTNLSKEWQTSDDSGDFGDQWADMQLPEGEEEGSGKITSDDLAKFETSMNRSASL